MTNLIISIISLGFMTWIDGIKENNNTFIKIGKFLVDVSWILNALNAFGVIK